MKLKTYILLILFSTSLFAQQKQVETKIDKTNNKIGAQFNLTLKTTVDTATVVVFPSSKSFGALEVIRSYVVDTIKKDDRYELIKKYGLTQFDSGRYVIPNIKVLINNKPFYSDTVSVHVQDVVVDTLKQKMFDIKPVLSEEVPSSNWWKWLLGILLFVGIGALIYYILKKRQENKEAQSGYATPIEKAIGMLQLLEKKQLWQKGEIKTHYSELTDIAREYIEEVIEIPAKESTTAELIVGLRNAIKTKKLSLTKEAVSNLEKVLKQADLVKFAKVLPQDFEITEDQKRIENSIISVHKSIPTEVVDEEDVLDTLQQKEKMRKKQKVKRIIITIVIVVLLMFATAIYFIATRGLDFVKDNILGHPTKELLEEKWIYSEYGNPNVGIETPKVLKRLVLPNQKQDPNVKEVQRFLYGSLLENFYINLITTSFKQEISPKLEQVITLEIQNFETQSGAKITALNQEEFQTKEGISGRKAIGTMSVTNPLNKALENLSFEVLVFNQQGGLQEIIITHRQEDVYASQIAQRVIGSVELKTTKE